MSYTTDPNDPRLKRGVDIENTKQNDVYLVLSEEERSKGFVRPVRHTYLHVGRLYDKGIQILDEPYVDNTKTYVAIVTVITDEKGNRKGGAYITQKELDQYNKTNGYIGGCGVATTMSQPLAETYARNPNFYGATYCVGCEKHLPLIEFVWDGTKEIVGS